MRSNISKMKVGDLTKIPTSKKFSYAVKRKGNKVFLRFDKI